MQLSGGAALTSARTLGFESNTLILEHVTQLRDAAQAGRPAGLPDAIFYAESPQLPDPIGASLKAVINPLTTTQIWARGFGDYEDRSGLTNFNLNGNPAAVSLGYSQVSGGFIAGSDKLIAGLTNPDDGLIFGIFAGFLDSEITLRNSAGRLDFIGATVGGHATYFNGGFFTDVIVKGDLLSFDARGAGLKESTGAQNFSALLQSGYKFSLQGAWYVEPSAGIEYIRTDFDKHFGLTATTIPLSDGDAVRGNIALRFGTSWESGGIRYEPSLNLVGYDIFDATKLSVAFGGPNTIVLPGDSGKARGEVQGALNFANLATKWAGFVRVDGRFGDKLVGVDGKIGVKYTW